MSLPQESQGHAGTAKCSARGDLAAEGLIDLTQAAACFADAGGRKPHVSTLRRWAARGCRGHRLETAFLGNRLMTSRQAAARFLAALSAGPAPACPAETAAADAAGRQLEALLK